MIYAVIASTIAHLLYIKKKLSAKPLDSFNKSAQKNEADFAGIRAGPGRERRTIVRVFDGYQMILPPKKEAEPASPTPIPEARGRTI